MDKLFVKMCNCPEIQDNWKPKEGDLFAFCDEVKIIKDYEVWAWRKQEMSDIDFWNEVVKSMGGHFVDHFTEARDSFVFLPQQGQIQDKIRNNFKSNLDMLVAFYGFVTVDQPLGFKMLFNTLMETWWLLFYMSEKHNKKWDGESWTKQ